MEDKIREIIKIFLKNNIREALWDVLPFEDLVKELSSLISNQVKIDCYSKTGEVIGNDKEIRAIEINSTDNKAKNLTSTNLSNDKGEVVADDCKKCDLYKKVMESTVGPEIDLNTIKRNQIDK